MRRRLVLCSAALLLWSVPFLCLAATLTTPATLAAEVGGFVSVPVVAAGLLGGERLELTLPDALQGVGTPALRDGRALVNLLVAKDAAAGSYTVGVRLLSGERVLAHAEVAVTVALRAGLELRAPEGGSAVAGEEVVYTLILTNTGNSTDTVRLGAESSLAARLEPGVLQISAGESAEARLVVRAEGRSRDLAIVRATSGVDPDVSQTAVVETEVLAFAGADALGGPALVYTVGAAGAYLGREDDGGREREVEYLFGASLDGELSDFLELESEVEFEDGQPSWAVGLEADAWNVRYQGSLAEQGLAGSYGPVSAFVEVPVALDGFGAGAAYREGDLSAAYAHTSGPTQTDAVTAGYTWEVTPDLGLTPSVSVRGEGRYAPDSYFVSGAVGLGAAAQTEALVGNVQLAAAVPCAGCAPSGEAWRAAAVASSRVQTPVGVQGELSLTPEGFGVAASSSQELGPEVTLSERLSYVSDYALGGRSAGLFGVGYSPLLLPLDLSGALGVSLEAGVLELTSGVAGSYALGDVTFSASLAQTDGGDDGGDDSGDGGVGYGLDYGVGVGYALSPYSAALTYARSDGEDLLSLGVTGEYSSEVGVLSGAAAANYNVTERSYGLAAGLELEITPQIGVFGDAELEGAALSLRVGASVGLEGGFATPGEVVAAFGGRAGGLVTGTVFRDRNRNGVRDPGEAPEAGLTVRAGPSETATLADGSYALVLPAGAQRLSLGGLPANLGVTRSTAVEVLEGETADLPLPVEEVLNLTGTVIDDADRNGERGDAEVPLPYVGVVLENADGGRFETRSGADGGFFFQSLAPGDYTLLLEAATLPERFEATAPPRSLTLTLGPSPRVLLGATAAPKVVEQTLSSGDLSVFVTATPNPAPPGGSVNVVAEVTGEPERVVATLGGVEQTLALTDGRYEGRVTVPADALGVAPLGVRAERGGESAAGQALVIVDESAPRARLEVAPALVDIGETVSVSGELYVDAAEVFLRVGGERVALERPTPYTFGAALTAAAPADTYEVELVADGAVVATTRFRVDAPSE